MKTLRDETVVEAPPEAVYEFLRTLDEPRSLAWHPVHIAFEYVDGGTRFIAENHFRIGPLADRSAHGRQSLTEMERPGREEGANLKRLVETGTASTVADRVESRPCRGAGEP